MHLAIRHETVYRFSQPASYTIQLIRLTPRSDGRQRIRSWSIETPGRRHRHVDAFDNICHTLVVETPHDELRVASHGVVEVDDLVDGRLETPDHVEQAAVPREVFLVPTDLTTADDSIRALAASALPHGVTGPGDLLQLARVIDDRVVYTSGATAVTTAAARALALGRGVCQDHAHIMLAVCRLLHVPARYVSGYIHPGDTEHTASHAWVDVWLPETGWLSVDVTHAQWASGMHCRIAVGRDYDSASPVRGVRTGGGEEHMRVAVDVDDAQVVYARAAEQQQ